MDRRNVDRRGEQYDRSDSYRYNRKNIVNREDRYRYREDSRERESRYQYREDGRDRTYSGRERDQRNRNDRNNRRTISVEPVREIPVKKIIMPDYDNMTQVESDNARADFRLKWGLLRTWYPELQIPEIPETTNLAVQHEKYVFYCEKAEIMGNIDFYSMFLVIIWNGLEIFLYKVWGMKFENFANFQSKRMFRYFIPLLKMAERGGQSIISSLPPEIQLILITLGQALIFLAINYISDWLHFGRSKETLSNLDEFIGKMLNRGRPEETINLVGSTNTAAAAQPQAPPGVPQPPDRNGPSIGGFSLGNMMNILGNMFGGGNNQNQYQNNNPTNNQNGKRGVPFAE